MKQDWNDQVALISGAGSEHGIGMAIVQDIVKSYHGSWSVDRSQELGGARFAIDLPCLA